MIDGGRANARITWRRNARRDGRQCDRHSPQPPSSLKSRDPHEPTIIYSYLQSISEHCGIESTKHPDSAKSQHTSTSEPRKPTPLIWPSQLPPSPCSRLNSPPPHPPPSAKQGTTPQPVPRRWARAVPTSPLPHGRWGPRRTRVTPRNPRARMRTRSARLSRSLHSISTASSSSNINETNNNVNPPQSSAITHPLLPPRSSSRRSNPR